MYGRILPRIAAPTTTVAANLVHTPSDVSAIGSGRVIAEQTTPLAAAATVPSPTTNPVQTGIFSPNVVDSAKTSTSQAQAQAPTPSTQNDTPKTTKNDSNNTAVKNPINEATTTTKGVKSPEVINGGTTTSNAPDDKNKNGAPVSTTKQGSVDTGVPKPDIVDINSTTTPPGSEEGKHNIPTTTTNDAVIPTGAKNPVDLATTTSTKDLKTPDIGNEHTTKQSISTSGVIHEGSTTTKGVKTTDVVHGGTPTPEFGKLAGPTSTPLYTVNPNAVIHPGSTTTGGGQTGQPNKDKPIYTTTSDTRIVVGSVTKAQVVAVTSSSNTLPIIVLPGTTNSQSLTTYAITKVDGKVETVVDTVSNAQKLTTIEITKSNGEVETIVSNLPLSATSRLVTTTQFTSIITTTDKNGRITSFSALIVKTTTIPSSAIKFETPTVDEGGPTPTNTPPPLVPLTSNEKVVIKDFSQKIYLVSQAS